MEKTDAGFSEKQVKESKSTKIPKKLPVIEAEPKIPEVSVADKPSTKKEIIPSKTGLLIREIPAPASPSSKKRRATDMAKHISKKKKKKKKKKTKMIISSESTTNEDEIIPETPEADLNK
ncbi:unnamed protein product [Lactuca saligna]|uniref:Uncharacterized protein n=1 Tax=Lactuca saligna TaxID=75948 RepID=A0AA35ZKY1_LACSI|nr:unnamed protein product [Lactuca saligna]